MPQPELGIALLGPVNVTLAGEDVKSDLYAKPQALLAYLAMSGGSHTREVIAGMFWGDKTDARALHNLRVNLTQAENVIGKRFPRGRQTLAFDRQSNYWLDVEAFEAGWQRSRLPDGRFDVDELRQAVELYRGPFMDDISLPDAPTFEEWQYAQRGRLEEIAVTAFDRLIGPLHSPGGLRGRSPLCTASARNHAVARRSPPPDDDPAGQRRTLQRRPGSI
jgi:DNA-binding SARP family transcriptional activator